MAKEFTKRKKFSEGNELRPVFAIVAVAILIFVSIFVEINIYKVTNTLLPKLTELGIGNLLSRVYYMMMVRTWVLIVLVGVLAIYLPVHLSHKFLGSRYRIEKEILEHIATGNLMHNFKLRQKDEMASMVSALNKMLGGLRTRVRDVEDFRKDIEKDIDKCLNLVKQGVNEDKKQQLINKLEALAKRNREISYLA